MKLLEFLQNGLLALIENVPLWTWLHMYYQHDGAPQHFTKNVMQSEWTIPWQMDKPCMPTELATMVTGSQSTRFPSVELHEKHDVWMHNGHEWWNISLNFHCCTTR